MGLQVRQSEGGERDALDWRWCGRNLAARSLRQHTRPARAAYPCPAGLWWQKAPAALVSGMAGRRVGLPSGLCHRAHAASRALVPLTASHLCCALPCRPLTAWRAGPGTRGAGSCCHPSTELLHVQGRGAASRGLWRLHWSGKWAASGHETPMLLEPACKLSVCLTSCILWRCLLFTKPSACWQLGCCNWYEIGTQVDKE